MAPYPSFELVLFWAGLVAYASAGATALGAVLAHREELPHFLRLFSLLGAAAHLTFLVAAAARTHTCPMFHLFEACVFAGAVASVTALIVDLRFGLPAITAVVSPLATVVSGAPYLSMFGTAPQAVPESATLPFHIALVAVAYSAFVVSFTSGLLYILQERELKRHSAGPLVSALPSLEATNALNARAVMVGFVLLTVGLAFGFTRAFMLDKPVLADGRVLGGVVTWACYGGLTAMRLVRGYHGRSAARMSIWSFAVAAFTMFGGTLLGTAVHRA